MNDRDLMQQALDTITALRERLSESVAQPEPSQKRIDYRAECWPESPHYKPAQVDPCVDGSCSCCWSHLDGGPAQQQEAYGWKVYGVNSLFMGEFAEADAKAEAKRIGGTCITFPLYTSPPTNANAGKPWVGLDAGDWNKIAYTSEFRAGADWAEAKLKEKNTR